MLDAWCASRYHRLVRTTLDIEDDVLAAAREVARAQKRSAGAVISDWARATLMSRADVSSAIVAESPLAQYGVRPLPRRGALVTDEIVRRLRDEEGI